MDVVRLSLRVPRRNIVRLCNLLEGYEGMAILRTVNPAQGLIELLVAPAFYDMALTLVRSLADEMELDLLDAKDTIPPVEERADPCDR